MKGILYLIPSMLGDIAPVDISVPPLIKEIVNLIDNYIVESEKSSRRFLIKCGVKKPIDELNFYLLNEHSKAEDCKKYILPLLEGKNMGLISDAGCPAIADPGAEIVALAHNKGIRVVPLTGASSIMLALMASGFNGQKFSFHGYLPVERNERIKKIKELEQESQAKKQTQIFIEAPYRNQKLAEDILQNCKQETLLCIACDITLPTEFIHTKNILQWKKQVPEINKRPIVFLIYAE